MKEIPAKTKKKKKPKREKKRTCKSLSAFVHRRLDKKKFQAGGRVKGKHFQPRFLLSPPFQALFFSSAEIESPSLCP